MLLICHVNSSDNIFSGLLWVKVRHANLPLDGDYWSSTSQNITYLICHVTQNDHVIEKSSDFMSGSASFCVTPLSNMVVTGIVVVEMFLICYVNSRNHFLNGMWVSLVASGIVIVGDIAFLICHIISKDHVIKWLCNFMSESFSR